MTSTQRRKPVFGIDIETCPGCGGVLRIIACIEDERVSETTLTPIEDKYAVAPVEASRSPRCRAPPQAALLDRATLHPWLPRVAVT